MLISEVKFEDSIKVNNYYLSKDKFIKYNDEMYYYVYGVIFSEQKIDLIIKKIIEEDKGFFLEIIGEYSIIVYNIKSDNIYILNDKAGRNLLYYSTKHHLSISEDFWGIIKYNKFTVNDVDELLLKEHVCFYVSLEYHTLFKELSILPNASYTIIKNNNLNIQKYWHFKLKENDYSTEKKYDMLHKSFEMTIEKAQKQNSSDTIYGIGVSGGMDSRLVPHYTLKNNMKLHSYIIGEEKPNKFLKSNDHISSDLVVDYFSLKHQKLNYNELTYKEKNRLDAIYNPIGTSQIFKIPKISNIDFDVLLTGASGFIVGASPFYNSVRNLPIETLIFDKQSSLKLRKRFVRLFKGINYLIGKDIFDTKDKIEDSIDGLITENEVIEIKKHLSNFLTQMNALNQTEKLMNYAIGILGHRNKSGSFESLLNHKENYALYSTYTLEMMKYLNEDEIYDRKLFEDFIKVRLPELANIKGQDHKTSLINSTPKFFQKLWSISTFTIRGQGVMNYHNWVKSSAFNQYIRTTLNEYDYVSKYFDIEKILKLTKTGELNSTIITNIIKHNEVMYLIDHIEKEYDGLYRNK